MQKLHFSVDSLVVRAGTYFGFGWIFHEDMEIQEVNIEVVLGNGEKRVIAAQHNKFRKDVAKLFPKSGHALYSGYIILGNCGSDTGLDTTFSLCGVLADNTVFKFAIPESCVTGVGSQDLIEGRKCARQWSFALERLWSIIKNCEVKKLYNKAKQHIEKNTAPYLTMAKDIQKKLSPQDQNNIILVIDHSLGGGANYYREQLVHDKINAGNSVVILSYDISTLSLVVKLQGRNVDRSFKVASYDVFIDIAMCLNFKEIIYNTGVSFDCAEKIPQIIDTLHNHSRSRVTILVHDFFMVCPSYTLLDDLDTFCGIPNIDRCVACLQRNRQGFISLFQSRDIQQWRTLWSKVISLADEVRFFSHDSLAILKKAYRTIDFSNAVVKPHKVDYICSGPIHPSTPAILKIGVVGHIGFHKGSKLVQQLAKLIKKRNLDIKIVIIGSIEAFCESSVVSLTDSYTREQLPKIIIDSGVNVMLFPSIWPETFSYVTQELIEMDMPIACFDLGAPAERLANYKKGHVIKSMAPEIVLEELISFQKRMYSQNG